MTRNALTSRYLDELARRGVPADEPLDTALRHADMEATLYRGRCLRRPAFLEHAEWTRVTRDLTLMHDALISLPDRLFGGDLAAFARACGMTDGQVAGVERGRGKTPGRLARADLFHDGDEFRLMELNVGSALGGLDNSILNQGLLHHPVVAEFVAAHHLSYVDSLRAAVDTLYAETGIPRDERPLVAVVDTPESFPVLEQALRTASAVMSALGPEMVPCHLGDLRMRDDRLWLDDRPIDVVYRVFLMEDLLDPALIALIDPVLHVVERGNVALYVPMDTELYGNKAALAMLSDEANRARFDAAEMESLDRLLPWTRMVRDMPVTVGGERVNLLEYARDQREHLVLKPTLMHGAIGVVLGWLTEDAEWRAALDNAIDQPFVVQRRIVGVPEDYPAPGGLEPVLLKWGVFVGAHGYAGALVSGSTDLSGGALNVLSGTTLGCCFHELPPVR